VSRIAYETRQLFEDIRSDSSDWREEAWDNWEFYYGIHWTTEQAEKLKQRGQYPYKIDRTSPIIENKIGSIMARSPAWDVIPTGWGANTYQATVRKMALQYIARYSDLRTAARDAVEASLVCGRGCLMVRFDPLADYGQGEIVIEVIRHPQEILVPWDTTRRDWEDADNIGFEKIMTVDQAKRFLSDKQYWHAIESQSGVDVDYGTSRKTSRYAGEGQKLHGDIETNTPKVCFRERYTKEIVNYHVLTPTVQGLQPKEVEHLSDDDKRNIASGYHLETTVRKPRIKRICCVGNEFLYDDVLPISQYPFSPIVHRHTGNPGSLGDIHRSKDQQISINKRWAVLLHIVSTSANPRIIYPDNSIDRDYWADHASLPGALLPYFPQYDGGAPRTETPNVATPVATLAKTIEMDAANMEYTLGRFAPDLGSTEGAPRTLGQTLAYKRYSDTRIRDYVETSLEPALNKMASVALEMVPSSWTPEKLSRVIDTEMSDPHLTDDQKQYLSILGNYANEMLQDVTIGRYAVRVVPGSTMDENPMAIFQHFLEMANVGAMDRETLIRQNPYIKDKEGLIKRLGERDQLRAQVEQTQSVAKRQEQVIKMQENEIRHARIDRDVAAHKAAMKGEEYKTRAQLQVTRQKMTDSIKNAESNRKSKIQQKQEEK
jgi:hypothetical protein